MPQLNGIVQGAPNKSKGFDADERISLTLSQKWLINSRFASSSSD